MSRSSREVMIGRTVGRYRIIAALGQGRMGSVWKAEDTLLGRCVALRLLPVRWIDSLAARRSFLQGGRAASTLNHPGVATVFDAGESEGYLYIAMRYVDGETLHERMLREMLAVEEAVRIAREAGEALAYAHSQGIVHGSVTSRSIMIARDGTVVLTDFGLARIEGEPGHTDTAVPQSRVTELALEAPQGQKADQDSDVYGLGIVLYEMVTGRQPSEMEGHEFGLGTASDKPSPSRYREGIPPDLDHFVARAVAKSPERRYPRAAEFLEALQVVAEKQRPPRAPGRRSRADRRSAVETAPSTTLESVSFLRTGAWRARQRWLLGSACVVLLVSLSAVLYAFRQNLKPDPLEATSGARPIPRVAVLPLVNLSPDPEGSEHVLEGIGSSLATRLAKVMGSSVVPWVTSRRFGEPIQESVGIRRIAGEMQVQALILGTFRMSGDTVYVHVSLVNADTDEERWTRDFTGPFSSIFDLEAGIAVASASGLKRHLTGTEQEELRQSPSRDPEAYRAYLEGEDLLKEGTGEATEAALQKFTRAAQLDPDFADAHVGIGATLLQQYYELQGGRKWLDDAEAHFRRALALNPRLQSAREGLIGAFAFDTRTVECLKLAAEARATGGDDVETLLVRAGAYGNGGLPDLAGRMLERVLLLDPANQGARWNLVVCNAHAARYETAIECGNRYLEEYGDDPEILRWVGYSYHQLGKPGRAMALYAKALRLADTDVGVLEYAAFAARDLGDREKQRTMLLKAVNELRRTLDTHPDNTGAQIEWAFCQAWLGNREPLRKEGERFLSSDIHMYYPGALGEAFAYLGEYQRALEIWRFELRSGKYSMRFAEDLRLLVGPQALKRPDVREFITEHERFGQLLRSQYGEPLP